MPLQIRDVTVCVVPDVSLSVFPAVNVNVANVFDPVIVIGVPDKLTIL